MVYRISASDRFRLQSNFTLVSLEYLVDSLAIEADYEWLELSDTLDPYLGPQLHLLPKFKQKRSVIIQIQLIFA